VLSFHFRSLLAISLLLSAVLFSRGETPAPKPTAKQIAQWVEQLGDDDFTVRENASKKLWQAGAAAEPALEKAIKSDDPEVVRRARELLDKFRWGIYPDTPADIVALIRAYQSTEGNPRMEVLRKLLDSSDAGLRAVLKITAAEQDENQRTVLSDLIAKKLPAAFLQAVTEEKYEPFERLLELGHEGKSIGHTPYAAYWLLRGKLAERIAHFAARLREHPEDAWAAQTLAYLHRANGDLVQARKAAEKADQPELLEGILYELGDWKALAERADIAGARSPAEKWAYRAAYARLAGKQKELENAVRELQKFAKNSEHDYSSAWKGLLLNDRPAEGLESLRTVPVSERPVLLFDILCARLDFAAALDLVKKETPPDKFIPALHLVHARLLCLLGDEEGEKLFDRYAEHIKSGIKHEWVQSLLKEEMRAGLKDRAFAHAAKAMSVEPDLDYLEQLFPHQGTTAKVWWTVLQQQFKDESSAAVLKQLRNLLEGKIAAKGIKTWIAQAEPLVSRWADPAGWRQALAETAAKAGLNELAYSLLEKADGRAALLHLGDLLAAKKQWDKAAERYQQAWKKVDPRLSWQAYDPLPLYLAGDVLIRAGQEPEGKKLIEQAHAVPFADSGARYNFIEALIKRGHKEAARREAELMLRVSAPNSFYSNDAFRRLARAALARKDYLQAAEDFEKSMLRCLQANTFFFEHAAYVNVPAQIHQLRASGLLAAGKLDEALKQIDLALTASPGHVDLPIALVPELERRGHKKEATALFERCQGVYEKVCRDYPRCAWAHNSTAWMAACCRRNLDKALEHAQKAVELAPANAGYLDTLAEVHFQRGDKDKAVALQKRVIELDPKKAYFRKQLKRLEAGDPSAERPPGNDD
jgi:tetratricopeptide (TPR) repeat protein